MKEIIYDGNIFLLPGSNAHDAACVTTNGVIRSNGRAVMGAGIAKYCRDNFTGVDKALGKHLRDNGNTACYLGLHPIPDDKAHLFMLFSFPTKHNWKDRSDKELIRCSCIQVTALADAYKADHIYLPCPGCSNGHLDYQRDVRSILMNNLDDRFIVCVPTRIAEGLR